MQFIPHQSHNGNRISLSLCLLLFLIPFSSLVHAVASSSAVSANSQSLSSLRGDFPPAACLSIRGCVRGGTTPRLSLHHCYRVAAVMKAGTRDRERREKRDTDCSSTMTASDCIKLPSSHSAKSLMRDIVSYSLCCSVPFSHVQNKTYSLRG